MNYRGYPERDLVSNRSSLLLFGASEADRRAWAEEAARNFEAEGPVQVAATDAELLEKLKLPRGVVYVPDITALGDVAQAEIVRVLRNRDERPKVVVGLAGSPNAARDHARLRTDLHYALHLAQVNLDDAETKDAIRTRRSKAASKRPSSGAKKAPAPSRARPASRAARNVRTARSARPARPARPAAKRKPASKPQKAKKAAARKPARRRR